MRFAVEGVFFCKFLAFQLVENICLGGSLGIRDRMQSSCQFSPLQAAGVRKDEKEKFDS